MRHILKVAAGTTGATVVAGKSFLPQPSEAINGENGYRDGSECELRLGEEGKMTLLFANGAGDDGLLHRRRFKILTDGKRAAPLSGALWFDAEGGRYRPGDEWFELYVGEGHGQCLQVVTPVRARVTRDMIALECADARFLLKKTRTQAAAFFCHAPRDAYELSCQVWQTLIADDFTEGGVGRFSWSTAFQTTADGKWFYSRCEPYTAASAADQIPSSIQLRPAWASGAAVYAELHAKDPAYQKSAGAASVTAHDSWRVECSVRLPGAQVTGAASTIFQLGLYDIAAGAPFAQVLLYNTMQNLMTTVELGGHFGAKVQPKPGPFHLALEGHMGWIYAYVDGELLGSAPLPSGARNVRPFCALQQSAADAGGGVAQLDFFVARWTSQLLQPLGSWGDRHLPGAPPPGGLTGEYFDDSDLMNDSERVKIILAPHRAPYARRVDSQINFSSESGAANWHPPGPPTGAGGDGTKNRFSTRWTGAIKLDLVTTDVYLRVSANDGATLWVGKTRTGEALIQFATLGVGTSGSVRTALYPGGAADYKNGWFPLVLEFNNVNGGDSRCILSMSTTGVGGTYNVVTPAQLSPIGVFNQQARFESHYELQRTLLETFGYQDSLLPQALESGLFPGVLIPAVRVGRDTEKVLDSIDASDLALELDADGVCEALLSDAQGIANEKQMTLEGFDFGELAEHLLVFQEYESLGEISYDPLFAQRIASLLTLRGSVWEQVSARPPGFRELVDAFPLAGALANFWWLPGDSVRLRLEELDVDDPTPRQILSVTRRFGKDGFGPPTVGFRQRPRSLTEMLRKLRRDFLTTNRNYQTNVVAVTGTQAGFPDYADTYSRVPLPPSTADLIRAELVVEDKSGTGLYSIELNGAVVVANVQTSGRFDVTRWITRAENQLPVAYARMVPATGVVGETLVYCLEISKRI